MRARLDDERARRRFAGEVEAVRRVAPFCTAQVLDADLYGDRPYIVSEYVEGVSLQRHVTNEGPRSGGAMERIAVGTATALAAIHGAGVVHRDFKPGNVLLGMDGPRVIDFGISRLMDTATTTGRLAVGTPAYISPEALRGERAGSAADMFGWALTVAFTASGRHAYAADTLEAVFGRILFGEPDLDPLSGPLRALVEECLRPDPDDRPTAEEVLRYLIARRSASAPEPAPAGRPPDDRPTADLELPDGEVLEAGASLAARTPQAGAAPQARAPQASDVPDIPEVREAATLPFDRQADEEDPPTLTFRLDADGPGGPDDLYGGARTRPTTSGPRRDGVASRRPRDSPASRGPRDDLASHRPRDDLESSHPRDGAASRGPRDGVLSGGRRRRVVRAALLGLLLAGTAGVALWLGLTGHLTGQDAGPFAGRWTGTAAHPSARQVFPVQIDLPSGTRGAMRWGLDLHCTGTLTATTATTYRLTLVSGTPCYSGTLTLTATGPATLTFQVVRQGESTPRYSGTAVRIP
ncbi:serine/threonine protein kinase [Sphaerisporangium rubeum]|uniref:non-specific serine/threonine protein kinase n=2 Tax=Sphaerisporangium rubeum TaxID=321317 RepID=A0A7X0M8M5_9ACTN|nr:serine/threonine protein kinase [Sphaerisporangium rubeum]